MYKKTTVRQFQDLLSHPDGLDQPVTTLKYIGSYLKDNLELASYNPQHPDQPFPIKNLRDLQNMLKTKTSRNTKIAREQLRNWLHDVLQNERANECLPFGFSPSNHIRLGNDTIRTYKINASNVNAEKSIIQFWRYIARENTYRMEKIPYTTRQRRIENRYPSDCEMN